MADEKKKQLYGGSYDEQIRDTAQQIQNRPAFSYDLDGDALYQQYKDRYTQNAKLGMKDTMGQAAALTGGYGNSYAQGVGQQRYDETMRGLTDMIPTLEQSAYQRWRDQGTDLQNRYSMLSSMAATEQATGQQNYAQLAQLIGSSGYKPTEEELANAGMSADQANAMLQMWIASNPQLAYNNGQISAEDFYKLTGAYPIGYTAPGGGGSGGGGGGGGGTGTGILSTSGKWVDTPVPAPSTDPNSSGSTPDDPFADADEMLRRGASAKEVSSYLSQRVNDRRMIESWLSMKGLYNTHAPYNN